MIGSVFSLVSMATRRVGARLKPCSLPSISPVRHTCSSVLKSRAKASIYTYGAGVLSNMTLNGIRRSWNNRFGRVDRIGSLSRRAVKPLDVVWAWVPHSYEGDKWLVKSVERMEMMKVLLGAGEWLVDSPEERQGASPLEDLFEKSRTQLHALRSIMRGR